MLTSKRLIFLASAIVYFVYIFVFWNYSIDDAFITFKYAENFADGYGLVFNIGDKPVEGYSNFLWLLLLSILYKIGLPTCLSAKLIGLSSFFIAAGILFYHHERDDTTPAWLAAPLLLFCPVTAFWGLSGLELGLHTMLVVGSAVALFRRSRWLYALLPLVVLSRPEGIAIGVGLIVIGALADFVNGRFDKTYFLTGLAVLAITVGALIIFRLQIFGYPLPNTYYAKIHHKWQLGFYELGRMLRLFAPLTIAFLWAIYRVVSRKAAEKELAVYVVMFVMQGLISARVDPVMNFLFRYMIPVMPFFLAATLLMVSRFRKAALCRVAIAAFAVSLVLPLPKVVHFVNATNDMMKAQWKVIEWAGTLPAKTTISISDMGRIPYYADNIYYYDIYGLVNEDIGHEGFSLQREFMRLPDYFVLVGYIESDKLKLSFWREQVLAYNETFEAMYQAIKVCAPEGGDPRVQGYYYFVFQRKSPPSISPRHMGDGN